jgi:hypothetical protein
MEPTAPAEGERRAIGGYFPQYRVSAALILRALRDRTLQWVRVADPEAGRVDDLQIGSESRVDALQVKWSQYPRSFTWRHLTTSSDDTPSLIAQLADGWRRLRSTHPGMRVVVHLVTNNFPSTGDHLPVNDPRPAADYFAAFMGQAWNPNRGRKYASAEEVPAEWRAAWEDLQAASGLAPDEFFLFIQDCELEFGYQLPAHDGDTSPDEQAISDDLAHLTYKLFETVADPTRVIHLARFELLERLGWLERYEFRSQHEFPVDESLYEPIVASAGRVEEAIGRLTGGYVGVFGTPGSGKSTLLTQTFRYRAGRVVRYYAFVPNVLDPFGRGESVNFLHDVVLALEQAGFRVGAGASALDRRQLRERFYRQLELLHQDWLVTGTKTTIMIDGLDHIAREQRPERSLLRDLPEQVPDGVLIVLGSQTDQLSDLPDGVQHAVRQPERRVEMQPLSRGAVFRITESATEGKVPVTEEQKGRIYELSAGHPLALVYLLNRLQDHAGAEEVQAVLDTTEKYEGSIERQYHSYWRQLGDEELMHLLGMLARLRRSLDLRWAEGWARRATVDRLRRLFAHYFRREGPNRWYFFHNSFRLFLVERTAEGAPGEFDLARHGGFHRELAERCRESDAARWRWEELYHLSGAEEHEAVIRRATPEWFHDQVESFRPVEAIRGDINLAMRSVVLYQDVVALVRLILIDAEMELLELRLENVSLISELVSLGEPETAADQVSDGNRLRVNQREALGECLVLRAAGMIDEAQRVFELSEPLELLSGSVAITDDHQDEKGKLLEAWAEAAVYFRRVEDIIAVIRRVRCGEDRFERKDPVEETRLTHNQMLFQAGYELIRQAQWEELPVIEEAFQTRGPEDSYWWFWLQARAWHRALATGDHERAGLIVEEVLRREDEGSLRLNDRARVELADGVYQINGDEEQVRHVLGSDPQQPALHENYVPDSEGLRPFTHRFRLNRLLVALGDERNVTEIVPDPADDARQGMVYFERAVCIIARIWGKAWRGMQLDGPTIVQEAFPIVALFRRRNNHDWVPGISGHGAWEELFDLLVSAVEQHGMEALGSLRNSFIQEWGGEGEGHRPTWPVDVHRQVVLAFWRAGGAERDWVVQQLRGIEARMLDWHDPYERIQECRKQAEAWLTVGEDEAARRMLKQTLRVSVVIGKDDFQLNNWIRWLGRVNELEPEKARERVEWFSRAVAAIRETDGPAADAARKLLEVAFRWSPRRAVKVFRWFLSQRLIDYEDGLRALLRAALERADPPLDFVSHTITNVVLSISGADRTLAQGLVANTARHRGADEARILARHLAFMVDVYTLRSTRPGWQEALARGLEESGIDYREAGFSPDILQPQEGSRSSYDQLKMKDGSTFSLSQAIEKASSLDGLRALLADEADALYLYWHRVVSPLIGQADEATVREIAALFESKGYVRHGSQVFAALGRRLAELGDLQGAWALGELAFASSSSSGWDRQMDGGTRIEAFQTLRSADRTRTRSLAFETLVRDLAGWFKFPRNIARNLDEILPLLSDDVPVKELWAEIERYVHILFEGRPLRNEDGLSLETDVPDDTPARAISDILAGDIDHLVQLLAVGWQQSLIELLLRREVVAQSTVVELLRDTEAKQECVLKVLDAVSLKDPDSAAFVREELSLLADSPNYTIRHIAATVCERLGYTLQIVQQHDLPPIYSLELPPGGDDSFDDQPVSETDFLPETNDPTVLVRAHEPELRALAKATGIAPENLFHRAARMMTEFVTRDYPSADTERDLRAGYDAIGLRLPYRRPRALLARRAGFHIVAELIDGGALSKELLAQMEWCIRFYDPLMLVVRPHKRPPEISAMDDEIRYTVPAKRETPQAEERFGVIRERTPEGNVILAEETTLKRLEMEQTLEARQSVVCLEGTPAPEAEADRFFYQVIRRHVREYPSLRPRSTTPPLLIISHWGRTLESPGDRWLALNPVIGRDLGLTLISTQDASFTWANTEGRTVIWSEWWQDGSINHADVPARDEVGEGWRVLATEEGYQQLKDRYQKLQRHLRVERQHWDRRRRGIQHEARVATRAA